MPKGRNRWTPEERERAGKEATARAAMKRDLRIGKEEYDEARLKAVQLYIDAIARD